MTSQVERRPDARIVRSALDEVKAIQTLLADVYKDAGDGRTLLRELVQNADDAEAKRLLFVVLDRGWPEAGNSLLTGPALLVVNDGPFPAKDRNALHQALGGSKAEDAGKVGRFGIGLKSVFHICEAIVYVGAERGILRPGALNPWAGTGELGDADPLHPEWDTVDDEDLERLVGVARQLLGQFDKGLLQWIPLRRSSHLDRAQDRQYGLGQVCPVPEDVGLWFGRSASLTLLLAQCGHLCSIEADRAIAPDDLHARTKLARVVRPAFESEAWIGRPDDDAPVADRNFEGVIENGEQKCLVRGIESLGLESLRRLRSEPDWPNEPHWRDGRSVWLPHKALAHAAVTVIQPDGALTEQCGARIRWAVFLPLNDDPVPRPSSVVESVGGASGQEMLEIVIHGYFWPSHDRRSIPGITDDDTGAGDSAVRVRWNRGVRDELLLPLLPSVLADTLLRMTGCVARVLLEAVAGSSIVKNHLAAVTRRHVLLPLLTENGVQWEVRDINLSKILSVPSWSQAPPIARTLFKEHLDKRPENPVFIDADAPRLGGEPGEWQATWIRLLLGCISTETLRSHQTMSWIRGLIRHVLGSPASSDDERAATVSRWLAEKVGEGALASTTEDATANEQKELRVVWRHVLESLPDAWLVNAPMESLRAVAELAAEGYVGEGLFPIPLGRQSATFHGPRPDPKRLDQALSEIGRRLQDKQHASQREHRSRLILAETFLAVRGDQPLGKDLSALPLLRARRLPDDKDEAWSVGELRRQAERKRVFARSSAGDGDDGIILESPSDPKRSIRELAEALGENVWFVADSVAATVGVPVPEPVALAQAVLHTETIQSAPAGRVALIKRLAKYTGDSAVYRAVRTLLTGRIADASEENELYFVRSQDVDRDTNQRTLDILLRLLDRQWCAVVAELVEPLPHKLVLRLRVKAVDAGPLRRLLDESLARQVDWTQLDQPDVLHLLQHFGITPEDRIRWRKMPLHRREDGHRQALDERTWRAGGKVPLPAELRTEIHLLEPDTDVADLYRDVPVLDDDGILGAMLMSSHPQQFADRIVEALPTANDGRVRLPRDEELCNLLKRKAWLPTCSDSSGLAPNRLLVVPPELEATIAPWGESGALGDYRLPGSIAPSVWGNAKEIVLEIIGRPSRVNQIQRVARALNSDVVATIDSGAHVIMPESGCVDSSLVSDALQTPLAGSHAGWTFVQDVANVVGVNSGMLAVADKAKHDAVLAIARSLCGPVPVQFQIRMLTTLSEVRPGKESPSGRLHRKLIGVFSRNDKFLSDVLPHITLPTQDRQWNRPHQIARSESGLARSHRVVSEYRTYLRLNTEEPVHQKSEAMATGARSVDTASELRKYFEAWANRVPEGAVGAFLSLLGKGKNNGILQLAQEWLGDDVSVEVMQRKLFGEAGISAGIRVFFSGRVAGGQYVDALNLLGELVKMEAGKDQQTIFAADPDRLDHWRGDFWNPGLGDIEASSASSAQGTAFLPFLSLNLRDVEPQRRTSDELCALLCGTVEWWASKILKLDLQKVRSWWSHWGSGSQAQIAPVQASILAHLPLTLHQLDVRDCEPLRNALKDAQRAQRKREQASPSQLREAMDGERTALDRLASLIRDDSTHRQFLWRRVQELIHRFGYRADSVLLELAQNADDALAQAAEIAGAALPSGARRLVIRVHEVGGKPTVDVTHHGRAINDTGGASFPAGLDRQWDQDLYFMMLLNLSGKPGEVPGQAMRSSTTGRFGLGFKSVHLVSKCPSVVSGFLAFSIAGGLLPQEEPLPDGLDSLKAEGHRATRVRLPLCDDLAAPELIAKLFRRFDYARTLLPAFARQLRDVVVDGGPCPGVSTFDGVPIEGAPGWSVAEDMTELPGQGWWRILRFRPTNEEEEEVNTAALAIGLRDNIPTFFPSDLPFLWNVAPTSENWGCGYAINGSFKLDPGRTHVSLDDDATLQVVNLLGEALGRSLVGLHDTLTGQAEGGACGLPTGKDALAFLAALWTLLSSGVNSPDKLRSKLLLRLHGSGCGLSHWMSVRAVVPSGLPAPFPERLPPLGHEKRIEVAARGLGNPNLCRSFAKIEDMATLAKSHRVVSRKVADRLRPLVPKTIVMPELKPTDVLSELAEHWDQNLTPTRLHGLRPLADEEIWKMISDADQATLWHSQFVARSAGGTLEALRDLLLPRDPKLTAEEDIRDELLRAAFAPDSSTLDPSYIEQNEDLTVYRRLRGSHRVDADRMAGWYASLSPARYQAALRYLLHGRLQREVLQQLVPQESRPSWLENYDVVRGLLDDLGEEDWRCQQLLAALFPSRFRDTPVPPPEPTLPESTKRIFFRRLQEWWNEIEVRRAVIGAYETKAWPSWLRKEDIGDSLKAGSQDHWLGLLVLGACQSLGWAGDGHHRKFLEQAHAEGWWEVFKSPDDTAPWMDVLRTWQDRSVGDLKYSRWMSRFPAIFQLSRYLETYRRLLRTAGRRPEELYHVTCLLAPRVDEALTGTGQQFDAPPAPLNMGLHWILRELVRMDVLDGDHLLPDCWVPSDQVLRFLYPLGLDPHTIGCDSNAAKAHAVFEFLKSELQTETPHLHRAFDIPLRYVDANADLRRQLGLEE